MSRYCAHSEAGVLLEQLESRQLMTALIDGGPVTFTELDGDVVTITLKGQGTGDVDLQDSSSLDSYIDLAGTNDASTLTVKIKKGPEGDGMALFRWIKVDGDLKALTAPGVWLSDVNIDDAPSVEITGWVGSISLLEMTGGTLVIGGQADDAAVAITFKGMLGVDALDSGAPVKSITAAGASSWDNPMALWSAPSFGSITIAGSYDYQGGLVASIYAAEGGIGTIKVTKGSIDCDLSASNGTIGNISATSGYFWEKYEGGGGSGYAWGGSIDVDIEAGQVKGKSVGNISAAGLLSAVIRGEGNVGTLTATGFAYKYSSEWGGDEGNKIVVFSEYTEATMELDIEVPDTASVGAVKATGGNVMGTVQAGTTGAFTVKGVLSKSDPASSPMMRGGVLDVTLTARAIGALSTTGGDLTARLSGYESLGKISGKAVTQNAAMKWFSEPGYDGEPATRWWEETTPSAVWGGVVDVTLSLGIDSNGILANNPAAKFGGITGTGMDAVVSGEVAAPLLSAVEDKITSKMVTYTMGFEDKYNDNGDVVGVTKILGEAGGNAPVGGGLVEV